MFAVIKTGGKQYVVSPGQKLHIEKLDHKEGHEVSFYDVFLVEQDGKVMIGTPKVEGAVVKAKIIKQGKEEKLVVFHFKTKKKEKIKKGFRQPFTEIEIVSIELKQPA